MIFILAEKPSVAASFAAALNVPKKDRHYEDGSYVISNCIGHLLQLCDAADYNERYSKWNVNDLPIIPQQFKHKPNEKTAKQLSLVKDLLSKKYDQYIIATDAGREGELIARLTLDHSGIKNYASVYRFWTSSALTKEVILESMARLKPAAVYDSLYQAGLHRQLADWLVGINFSRFFTVKLQDKFIFGRVQTPVLNMIVQREKAIASFVKSFFYRLEVRTEFTVSSFSSYLVTAEGKRDFDGRQELDELLPSVPGTSTVTDVSREIKTDHPPKLLDLTELQKLANKKFGYTAAKTLDLAQALYEKHKCLSYPRTASRYLSRSNFDLFVQCLDALGIDRCGVDPGNKNIFNDEAMEKNKEDHHALLALANLPEAADQDERNVYELVVKTMSTVVKPPFVYEAIAITHKKDSMVFVATGRNVIEYGWKEKQHEDPDEDEDQDEEETQAIPDLKNGDFLVLMEPRVTEHERKPPKSFTEAAILAAMKHHGLGTPATRDTIIEGLVRNEYCYRKGKKFLPSQKAFFFLDSIAALGHEGLLKYLDAGNTGEWENLLESEPGKFFSDIKYFVDTTIGGLKEKDVAVFQNSVGECPMCGASVISGKFSWYCTNHKEKGCAFSIGKTICEADVTESDVKSLLAGKQTGVKSMKSKNGKDFKAKLKLSDEFKVLFEFQDVKESKK